MLLLFLHTWPQRNGLNTNTTERNLHRFHLTANKYKLKRYLLLMKAYLQLMLRYLNFMSITVSKVMQCTMK